MSEWARRWFGIKRPPTVLSESMKEFWHDYYYTAVQKMTEWISVKDRLPEDDEMVLVTAQAKNGHRSVNRAYHNEIGWHGSGSMAGVTAWMPMPEPYEEKP